MEDKGVDCCKPGLEPPEPPSVNRSIVQSLLSRQSGGRSKSCAVPTELQWAAEDKMIMRTHEEYKCELPDVPRSTFLMVFSPDGKKVASTHGNHNVYVTDVTSGKNIKTLSGHPRTPWCIAFHPSSNQILASGCLGGQVRVWDLSGGSEIWMAEGQTVIASLAFHPVDRMLVIGTYNELYFWDWSRPKPFAKCFTSNEREKIRYVAFDALGHKLLTGIANAPQRAPSQWDRVAAPQPPPQDNQLDPWGERRITICYRYMVEQYEQLVQRYCDLSRARATLTMDRGTDPMEPDEDSTSNHNANNGQSESRSRPPCLSCDSQRTTTPSTSRARFSSGTDETSASHSSTNFLTSSQPSVSRDSTQNVPFLTPQETSTNGSTNTFLRNSSSPRRNPRFDITLPSFSSLRTRSSSIPAPNSTGADPPSTLNPGHVSISVVRGNTPTPFTRATGINMSSPLIPAPNNTEEPTNRPPPLNLRQRLRNLMFTLRNRRSTEVNSSVDSEYEEAEGSPEPRRASHSDTEEQRTSANTPDSFSPPPTSVNTPASFSPPPTSVNTPASFSPPPTSANTPAGFSLPPRPSPTSTTENSSRRLSEGLSVSQLRSQFHRLQSVYENRNSNTSTAHVFSAETQSAERRLLNRINEIFEQPLPEPRSRRLFVSRHSAFQPRAPQPSSQPPDILRGVRYGIQLLSRHIDNMQRLCRARLEILQLQQIRRMWEDLQSQIYALHEAMNQTRGASTSQQPADDLLTDDDSDEPSNNGELHWRQRQTPQTTNRRNFPRVAPPRPPHRNPPPKRSRMIIRWNDAEKRAANIGMIQQMYTRRLDQAHSSKQADGGGASCSQVSGEREPAVRGVKRKARDPDPLLSPTSTDGASMSGSVPRGASTSGSVPKGASTSGSVPRGASTSGSVPRGASTSGSVPRRASTSGSVPRGASTSGSVPRGASTSGSVPRGVVTRSSKSPNTRPSASTNNSDASSGTNTAGNVSPSHLAAMMRSTIADLENMLYRHRQTTPQRSPRLARFIRQQEERRMRHLWDSDSSHESEGETTQQNTTTAGQSIPERTDPDNSGWASAEMRNMRIRAREVLLLMVDSLTQFFESDNFTNRSTDALYYRINDLTVLLQLALNLTDLLLAQLLHSSNARTEADRMYRYRNRPMAQETYVTTRRFRRMHDRFVRQAARQSAVAWRRTMRRFMAYPGRPSAQQPPADSIPPAPESRQPPVITQASPAPRTMRSLYTHPTNQSARYPYQSPARPVVPVVRVNDQPAPPPDNTPFRGFRPHSPPPISPHPMFVPARFLHPGRYMGGSGLVFDELSTSEDSSPQERSGDFFFMRAGYGSSSVILTDTPMSPQHRIQAWDFSEYKLPHLASADKNMVVSECKIHNDASVDVSKDGRLLVALLPSGRVSMTTLLGIYSLQWDTLGQLLYTTSFEQSIVSVSLSPTARHLVVGLASRRVTLVSSDRLTYAQVFRLEGASPGRKAPLGARGRLVQLRDLGLSRHFGFMSLNCIRWAPNPGQGLVYGTNTGQLKILR